MFPKSTLSFHALETLRHKPNSSGGRKLKDLSKMVADKDKQFIVFYTQLSSAVLKGTVYSPEVRGKVFHGNAHGIGDVRGQIRAVHVAVRLTVSPAKVKQ